ncbi:MULTISPECIES: C39 family peptidase [Pseudomonas]|uniref:C39 family peptidase n=1 Tax=Pseudomonas nitroreducens TaxID=46680 RepID=A0A6G6IY42_PSENT|nr:MULTISPECIES: C39 family peptidase [Pseudomonas]MBG6290771.1 C39 family peptidase [Pseudomonas nitroreducens]MCJ1878398.1 C39 family peptidase [Pseudomonas nitroreducens]MCJ1894771.1 C39 family peptidase [Pseudomonas nitroreducens]NMZ59304.1 peptidase C39 [Pseudomonas nitroreducens]NNN24775.1 peptidase C39 [Pseudomonas nitroreducens]
MRSLFALTLLLLTGIADAAYLPFAALPGGNLAYKEVQSIRERRFADLVEQKTDFSCGAAALATILEKAYNAPLDEQTVIQGMLTYADADQVRKQGFSMLDMKRYVESMGMRARGYRIQADQLEQLKIPVIVLMEIRGYKHFVVLQRTQDNWVYVGDPALGHKRYTRDDFNKGWNGIVFAVIGHGYDRNNPLLSPPEPLTARDRLDHFRPVRDADLMDFGFIHSDFF